MLDRPLKLRVEQMDTKALDKFLNTKNLRKRKLTINFKNCESEYKCFLTYTLAYQQSAGTEKKYDVEVKKIAELTSDSKGIWKIADITDIKSHIHGHKSIDIPAKNQ